MSITVYDIGDTARVTGLFYDANDALADPSALTFSFKDPSGNVTSYVYITNAELVKSATGTFYVDLIFDEAGDWFYLWIATGARAGAQEGQVMVRPRQAQ